MPFVDTHAHIFLDRFDADRTLVIKRALSAGVDTILMPNIDAETLAPMMAIHKAHPEVCWPMMGLHPVSVDHEWKRTMEEMEAACDEDAMVAVGETGLDLYWDKSHVADQKAALKQHLIWAQAFDLPIVLHVREAFAETFEVMDAMGARHIKGVFHCFSGGADEIEYILARYPGFYFGIGGVLTFKNSGLSDLVGQIPENRLLLETDAPFLAPVPHRGKRNEPAFIPDIAKVLGRITGKPVALVAEQTTENAKQLFDIG